MIDQVTPKYIVMLGAPGAGKGTQAANALGGAGHSPGLFR